MFTSMQQSRCTVNPGDCCIAGRCCRPRSTTSHYGMAEQPLPTGLAMWSATNPGDYGASLRDSAVFRRPLSSRPSALDRSATCSCMIPAFPSPPMGKSQSGRSVHVCEPDSSSHACSQLHSVGLFPRGSNIVCVGVRLDWQHSNSFSLN